MSQHAIINFENHTVGALPTAAGQIANGLDSTEGRLIFTDLPVSPAILRTQIGAFNIIQGKPDYHGKGADSDAARLIIETSLHDNGVRVNTVAKGNLVMLAISGYPISLPGHPVGPLAKGTLKVTPAAQNGAFDFEITGVHHERGFLICFAEASNPETDPRKWGWHWTAKTKGTMAGLAGSVKYKLAVVALGTDPTLTFSDVVTATTQG